MRYDKQFCTVEQGMKFRAFGYINAQYNHVKNEFGRFGISNLNAEAIMILEKSNSRRDGYEFYPAFTLAELGELLPEDAYSGKTCHSHFRAVYNDYKIEGSNETILRADLVIYLLEQNIIPRGDCKV